jgi:2',3'-cyclic-nucleotide 2'-phosphodiesterase (5'-nucleotidase family)
MPEGDVILDDILSMFPFKNSVVYLELKGSRLRKIFETMAATRFQAVSGVDILVENGRLSYVKVGGQPLEDDRTYGVATISFLLNGGDSLFLAEGAENIQMFDCTIVQAALKYIEEHDGKIVAPDVRYVTIK